MTAPTCTALRERLGVATAGTASLIRSWLLLEHPGPWSSTSRDDVFAAALGPDRWADLRVLWVEQQLRPLLVRRPAVGGRRPSSAQPQLLVGSTAGPGRFLERLAARDLPGLDLQALADGRPGHGEPVDGPLLAVCTNGAVDRCCAVRGRPLAAELARVHPDRTWEVTHVGGCRFAANLLVLPSGVVHGAVTPAAGLQIAAAALCGEVLPEALRGRTGSSPYAGTAEVVLRQRLGLRGLDDVVVLDEAPHPDLVDGEDGPEPAGADVLLSADGRAWRAVVRSRSLGERTSVCDGTEVLETTDVLSLLPA